MSLESSSLLSFVIPVKDEEGSIVELTKKIFESVDSIGGKYKKEIIFIDDGSYDKSWELILQLAKENPGVIKAIRFRRNFGKSVALESGFNLATGDLIFTMDADLQDDPKEIPRFIDEINKGYDLVSGWKEKRNDPLSKTLPSKLFNKVTSWTTGIQLHDFNCGFKCYKQEIVKSIKVYGELHRYVPVLAHDMGYRVGEIAVEHHPRQHGKSKYGWERYARGFIDLLTVLATTRWLNKPGHLFGGFGLLMGLLGSAGLFYLSILWLFGLGPIGNRPLLLFSVMFCILSLQMISLGVIAEFFIRTKNPRDIKALISEIVSND